MWNGRPEVQNPQPPQLGKLSPTRVGETSPLVSSTGSAPVSRHVVGLAWRR